MAAKRIGGSYVGIAEFGAAKEVGGSKGLLTIRSHDCIERHLIDFGLDYSEEGRKEGLAPKLSKIFPIPINCLDSLLLTHAHADHMGDLSRLYDEGFRKPIHATSATAAIAENQLNQQMESERYQAWQHNQTVKGQRDDDGNFIPFKKPEFTKEDVHAIMALFEGKAGPDGIGHDYGTRIAVSDYLRVTFYEAGHIPGSAQIDLDVKSGEKRTRILTCCDLGRTDYKIIGHPIFDTPLIRYPKTDFPASRTIEYVVTEATYGDKTHAPISEAIDTIIDCFDRAKNTGGKLIIPVFSIMRMQLVLNELYVLRREGKIPKIPIYVSSPSGEEINKIMVKHMSILDEKAQKDFEKEGDNPFDFDGLHYVKDSKENQALYSMDGPYALIASSGMCSMGRVVGHLQNGVSDEKNVVMLTGYQARDSLGYALQTHEPKVTFPDGTSMDVSAYVTKVGGLSGHADGKEIVAHLTNIKNPKEGQVFKKIFIKHGEPASCEGLRNLLINAGYPQERVIVMGKGIEYPL